MNIQANLTFLGANDNPYSFVDKLTKVTNEGVSHIAKFMDIETNEVLTFKIKGSEVVKDLNQFENCIVQLSLSAFKGVNQINFICATKTPFEIAK